MGKNFHGSYHITASKFFGPGLLVIVYLTLDYDTVDFDVY